jgi:hypothetical protein
VGRKGRAEILLCKISARPCILDCSGNPAANREAVCEELQRKARFFGWGLRSKPQPKNAQRIFKKINK